MTAAQMRSAVSRGLIYQVELALMVKDLVDLNNMTVVNARHNSDIPLKVLNRALIKVQKRVTKELQHSVDPEDIYIESLMSCVDYFYDERTWQLHTAKGKT